MIGASLNHNTRPTNSILRFCDELEYQLPAATRTNEEDGWDFKYLDETNQGAGLYWIPETWRKDHEESWD